MGHRLRQKATALLRHEARRILIPLAVLTAISSVATVAAPGLAGRPLLLVALSPRLSFLALAAPKVGLAPFLAVAGVRLCLADPFHFVLGRRHGTKALDKLVRWDWLKRVQHAAAKSVPLLVFLRPNGTNLAIAGASRNNTLHIAVADVVGTLVYLLIVHQLGASFLPH
jgi:membrane protein DedA with SNARE-associated domain